MGLENVELQVKGKTLISVNGTVADLILGFRI